MSTSDFNPRSPHGERRGCPRRSCTCAPHFNPRSPHGERRPSIRWRSCAGRFQSTLPARGATGISGSGHQYRAISIHAPRTGSDVRRRPAPCRRWNFNPRSPHGERRGNATLTQKNYSFQSTLPARGATWSECRSARRSGISIHAPRTGSDASSVDLVALRKISIHAPRTGSDAESEIINNCTFDFNPRSPHGERRRADSYIICTDKFQSTLPARGAT